MPFKKPVKKSRSGKKAGVAVTFVGGLALATLSGCHNISISPAEAVKYKLASPEVKKQMENEWKREMLFGEQKETQPKPVKPKEIKFASKGEWPGLLKVLGLNPTNPNDARGISLLKHVSGKAKVRPAEAAYAIRRLGTASYQVKIYRGELAGIESSLKRATSRQRASLMARKRLLEKGIPVLEAIRKERGVSKQRTVELRQMINAVNAKPFVGKRLGELAKL